jgi:hypothetical protein
MVFILSLQKLEGDNQVLNIIEDCVVLSEFGEEQSISNVNSKKKIDLNNVLHAKIICLFGVCVVISLCVVEIACIAFIHTWNDEVFKAVTGLAGVIIGFLVFRKTKR